MKNFQNSIFDQRVLIAFQENFLKINIVDRTFNKNCHGKLRKLIENSFQWFKNFLFYYTFFFHFSLFPISFQIFFFSLPWVSVVKFPGIYYHGNIPRECSHSQHYLEWISLPSSSPLRRPIDFFNIFRVMLLKQIVFFHSKLL